ncbi:glycerol-3-phosphate dehydrogenase/oxidase [Shouchella lehensis]|uniref:Glycerol-3-phosphate dehydrogenase n=2 Tax=Shouchella lehensis TaxID=300825 RepID=A0A060M329_9BACI|nr:FAD-dependent oxidoreductase [Shouchella lehensis]AIC96430.1 glycerol-3-phosphate dehydrogenase [Shouchella lehensis G1]MBG9785291.1 glycerol-3-phosphate dehydrogenase [Shouchella lehensis]TES46736.1 glycerol-3-phosphate dehydrogenase/oxidase [Shouchella lehensis]
MPFSTVTRTNTLQSMQGQQLDLLVIGGGITGTGIALDAQTRGLSTGLIEMQDFAAGTSSRSTKLIHGGLRYLKQFEIKLVAEVGKERAIVYENAPHVTEPVRMMLPFYKGGTFNAFTTSLGLSVYDRLAGVKKDERRTMMNAKEALKKESILASEGLKGAGMYVEYRTDDARLTMEVAKSAAERGAKLINYVKADSFLYENGKLVGVQATDRLTGESVKIYARKIINATGPWVDTLREQDRSREGKSIHHTKGVHLVLSKERLPLNRAVYFDTPFGDGRMMFAIPRGKKVYVGTTDTNFKGDQKEPGVTIDDVNYILDATNQLFPGYHLTKTDVESSWSGIRPLIHEDGKDPSEISRKDEIFHSKSGLMTIAGGKLTGYRKMADTIVSIAAEELSKETGKSYPSCQTKEMALSGGHVGGSAKYEAFKQKTIRDGVEKGLTQDEAQEIAERYGSNAPAVFSYLQEDNHYDLPKALYAMLRYGIEQEMTVTAVDFLMRRVSYLLFDIDQVDAYKDRILNAMSDLLQWSEEEKLRYSKELNEQVNLVTLRGLQ